MLGRDICSEFSRRGHQVIPVSTDDFDIANFSQTLDFVRDIAPELVIHCAAYTDVDGCERDPDKAYRVNAVGAHNVASACAEIGAAMVAISTDFVFDGEKGDSYTEFDKPHPLGAYGASKLAGENLVRAACPKHYIVRTSWLYGLHGKSFPGTMLRLAETRNELSVVKDQVGSPTFTLDLAEAIADLIAFPLYGVYHISNSGETSWAGFAEAVFEESGKSNINVKPIRSDEWPSPTTRPAHSVLRSYMFELQGRPVLRNWRDALIQYILLYFA